MVDHVSTFSLIFIALCLPRSLHIPLPYTPLHKHHHIPFHTPSHPLTPSCNTLQDEIELSAFILSHIFWPTFREEKLKLPEVFQKYVHYEPTRYQYILSEFIQHVGAGDYVCLFNKQETSFSFSSFSFLLSLPSPSPLPSPHSPLSLPLILPSPSPLPPLSLPLILPSPFSLPPLSLPSTLLTQEARPLLQGVPKCKGLENTGVEASPWPCAGEQHSLFPVICW